QERDFFTWSVDIDQTFGSVTAVAQVCLRPVRLIIEHEVPAGFVIDLVDAVRPEDVGRLPAVVVHAGVDAHGAAGAAGRCQRFGLLRMSGTRGSHEGSERNGECRTEAQHCRANTSRSHGVSSFRGVLAGSGSTEALSAHLHRWCRVYGGDRRLLPCTRRLRQPTGPRSPASKR